MQAKIHVCVAVEAEVVMPLLVKSRCFAHLVTLGPVSMMLRRNIVKPVKLVDRIEMRKTDCFGKTRLVLHALSSS